MSALWPSLDFKSLFVLKVIWTTHATPVSGNRVLHTLTTLPQSILGGFLNMLTKPSIASIGELPAHTNHTFHSQYWGASCMLTTPSIASIGGLPAHADHASVCFTPVHKPPPQQRCCCHTQQNCRLSSFHSSLLSIPMSNPGKLLYLDSFLVFLWVPCLIGYFAKCSLIYHCLVFPHDVPRVADLG